MGSLYKEAFSTMHYLLFQYAFPKRKLEFSLKAKLGSFLDEVNVAQITPDFREIVKAEMIEGNYVNQLPKEHFDQMLELALANLQCELDDSLLHFYQCIADEIRAQAAKK
jgi:hypothetical protein